MLHNYHVYYDDKIVGTVVAMSERSAIDKVYNKTIGASRYSGNAYDRYSATRI